MKSQNLREEVHFRVLRLLSEKPSASQREISNALGVSLGLVNYCLNALVEKGAVKISNFRAADNKLRYAYVLTPSGLSEKVHLTSRFLQRKIEEFEALQAEIAALREEAGMAELASRDRGRGSMAKAMGPVSTPNKM